MKYRKRTLEVEAVYFDGSDESHERIKKFAGKDYERIHREVIKIYIYTEDTEAEHSFYLHIGFWLIKGIENELYACKDSEFQKTYDKVE